MGSLERLAAYGDELAQPPPSDYAIADLVNGVPGAFGRTLFLTALRAVPIGIGLHLVGVRQRRPQRALGISGAVTVTMIGYAYGRKRGWWT